MSDTVLDIITDALFEIGVVGVDNPTPSAGAAALGLRALNRELDARAALRRYVYDVTFTQYTLTPNHQPHLIGPALVSPDFAAAQRPMRIEGANLVLNNVTPNVDVPIAIRDKDWWNNERVKSLTSAVPTDLYYAPAWPNGALWLWPTPTFAYGLRLEAWTLISQFTALTNAFSLPPGYKLSLTLRLAQRLCRPFGRQAMPDLERDANKADADLQTANISSPRIGSADYGTGAGRGTGGFNYYTGR